MCRPGRGMPRPYMAGCLVPRHDVKGGNNRGRRRGPFASSGQADEDDWGGIKKQERCGSLADSAGEHPLLASASPFPTDLSTHQEQRLGLSSSVRPASPSGFPVGNPPLLRFGALCEACVTGLAVCHAPSERAHRDCKSLNGLSAQSVLHRSGSPLGPPLSVRRSA
jgi:hypothetical protein